MAQGISDASWKAVYNSLRQQGYSHTDAVKEAAGVLAWGAAPEDPVFGVPESRVDGAPSEPLVMDAVVGRDRPPMPYPPMNYGQYRDAAQLSQRGLGPMPQDSVEHEGDVRMRYDGKYGAGSYEGDRPGREFRATQGQPQATPAGYEDFAAAAAEVETGKTKAQRLADIAALEQSQEQQKDNYFAATGMPQAPQSVDIPGDVRDWSNWQPGMPLPKMVDRTDVALAVNERKEQERDARLQPMMEANRRDMTARSDWAENNPDEAANLREGAKERGDDYRKEQLLYRMAKSTGKSIEQLRAENPQFASVGMARDGLIPSLDKTADGYQVRGTPVSTSRMRDDARQARLAAGSKREEQWRAQMTLAGANPAKNAVNTFGILTPEQQQDVIATRMKFGQRDGGKSDEWDRRLDMLRIQMENASTERDKDRGLQREGREAQEKAEQLRFDEDAKRRKQDWDKFVADQELKMLGLKQSHETSTLGLQGTLESLRQQGEGSKAERDALIAKQQQMEEAQKRAMEMRFATESPGEYAAARGLQTPEAADVMKRLASESDRFQWLPGGGFGEREAGSMNAALIDLARRAEMAGVPTRLNDRAYREELIRKYGYASGWSGGRGGWTGDWWQPIPSDPTVAQP
jgi:hypothetical protein